ncbi:MAG: NTP transferase domain-containing protein [Alphaproteobacteria bacterium]
MEFKDFPLHDALGVVTATCIALGEDNSIPAGKILDYTDVAMLKSAGYHFVCGAKIVSSDLLKNTAIVKLASAIAGNDTAYRIDDNGRCFIYAAKNGLANIDTERVERFNRSGQEVILATIPPFSQVSSGQMLAAVSLIPPAISEDNIEKYLKTTLGLGSIVNIAPYKPKKVYFIQSFLSQTNEDNEQAVLANIAARVASFGATVVEQSRCEHLKEEIYQALSNALASNAEIIIFSGAFANYHKDDVIVKVLEEASFEVDNFFVPNFPGENILIANYKKYKKIIVLPDNCNKADYSAIDLILRRVMADCSVTYDSLIKTGAGGLLTKEAWQPVALDKIENLVKIEVDDNKEKIAVVILAAGKGARMMGDNKLLYELEDGKTIISNTVDAALKSKASPVVVVTGFEEDLITEELKDKDVIIIKNNDFTSGVSTSIKTGLEVLNQAINGAVILPGDMPFVTPEQINRLIEKFDPLDKKAVCVSTSKKVKSNPILWARSLFSVAKIVPENAHLHPVLVEHYDYLCEVPFASDDEALDVNTVGDIDALKKKAKKK